MKILAGIVLGASLTVSAIVLPLPWASVVMLAILLLAAICVIAFLNAQVNAAADLVADLTQAIGIPPELCGLCLIPPPADDRVILDVIVADELVHVPAHISCVQEKLPHLLEETKQ